MGRSWEELGFGLNLKKGFLWGWDSACTPNQVLILREQTFLWFLFQAAALPSK